MQVKPLQNITRQRFGRVNPEVNLKELSSNEGKALLAAYKANPHGYMWSSRLCDAVEKDPAVKGLSEDPVKALYRVINKGGYFTNRPADPRGMFEYKLTTAARNAVRSQIAKAHHKNVDPITLF